MRTRKSRLAPGLVGLETRSLLSAFYVATDGNDANPGTAAAPWATLQHAVSSVKPGDAVEVESGTYAGCRIENSGTAAAPITLEAAPGATVVINRPGPHNYHGSDIEVENFGGHVDYWTIRGLQVTGASKAGIDLRHADHDTVIDCYAHNNTLWGIFTGFTNYLTLMGNHCSYSAEQHGIYVSNSSSYDRIIDNEVDHNRDCGIQINADVSEGGTGLSVGCVISGNYAHDNGWGGGAALNFDGLQRSQITGNRLINNLAGGIVLYKNDAAGGSKNNIVTDNVIQMTHSRRFAINIYVGSTGNDLRGNTIESTSGAISIDSSSRSGFYSDYNTFGPNQTFSVTGPNGPRISLTAWRQATGQDKDSTVL